MMGMELEGLEAGGARSRGRGLPRMAKAKKKPKADSARKAEPPPNLGRLGAERWIAVRQKSGAGPIEPKTRKQTRTERDRDAITHDLDDSPESG